MPGLIEALGGGTGDPNKDAAINQGILQMGLAMLQSKGSLGQALGQGGMAGLQGYQGAQDQQFLQQQRVQQQKQWEEQNRQAERQRQMQALAPQFYKTTPGSALSGAEGAMFPGEATPATREFDWDGYIKAVEGIDPMEALKLRAATTKDNSPLEVKEGTTLLDRKTMKPIFTNPKSDSNDPVSKLIAARDALPPNHPDRKIYDAAISKASTHSPAVTVANYGSPVPVQLPDGSTGLVQPSNKAGQPPVLMKLPGSDKPLAPAKDPAADKPLTESQARAAAYLDQMRSASSTVANVGMDSTQLGNQMQVAGARTGIGNAIAPAKAQQVKQAQDQWSESFLRFKTGAAATKEEVELNNRTFFPQPGDKPEVVRQKAEARRQAEHSVSIAAGKGAGQAAPQAGRQVKRTGVYQGKKVIEYDDGSVEFQN